MSLADYQTLVSDLVRDKDGVVSSPQRDTAIQSAVLRYSADRPRAMVLDVTSPGGYRLPLPGDFVDGLSVFGSLEYPIGNQPPTLIDVAQVRLYRAPLSIEVQLPIALLNGDQIRLSFTTRHALGASDTIPLDHRMAVASWAASLICEQMANYYATEGESSIGADAVDHQSKTDRFAARARAYRAQYLKDLGIDEKRMPAASAIVDLDLAASHGGGRLFQRGVRR